MYYDYFGLKEAPFSIAPNPEYLFMTERHQEALAHLYHGINSDAGFVLLTGDIGTGKTTICRCFLSELPEDVVVAFILNPFLGARELLYTICQELKIDKIPENISLRALTQMIHNHLLENYAKGLQTILLIDEAQHITVKVLELIRLLTNLETDKQKLLKIILVGQPELNDKLKKPELLQLSQRITARYHIQSLTMDEISAYINYRLNVAGCMDGATIFPKAIVKKLFTMTQGVPRVVNTVCDRALLGVYSQNKREVDVKILKKAFVEIRGDEAKRYTQIEKLKWLLVGGIAFVLFVLLWLVFINMTNDNSRSVDLSQSSESLVSNNNDNSELLTSLNDNEASASSTSESLINTISKTFLDHIYLDQNSAKSELIRALFIPGDRSATNCTSIRELDWQCQLEDNLSWQQLTTINRPAVMTLVVGDVIYYGVLISLSEKTASLAFEGRIVSVPVDKIKANWNGDASYLWQPPRGFVDYIYFDSSPVLVEWLASAYASIDQQSKVLANAKFTTLLKQRTVIFQRKYNLEEDGIVGRDTVLRINEALGIAKILSYSSVANQAGSSNTTDQRP